jgi:thiol-disulfide isomerase/thioredoxin
MCFRKPLLVFAMALGALPAFARAVVQDSTLEAAAKEYHRLFDKARDDGDMPGIADMGDFTDQVLANVPLDQLTPDQIQRLVEILPVEMSPKTAPALDAILAKLASANDASGGRAAILRLHLLFNTPKPDPNVLPRLQEALAHPGVKAAVADGYGSGIFETALQVSAADLPKVRDGMLAIGSSVGPNSPSGFFMEAAKFYISLVKTMGVEGAMTFSPLREQTAAALQKKLATQSVDDPPQPRLQQALADLTGAYARGNLVGFAAPDIQFEWYRDGSGQVGKIRSLSELQGKVVVLDFWTTWCGPCVAAFPHVKALSRYYKGFDVAVIGVTSYQGYISMNGGHIEAGDDHAKEIKLLDQFAQAKDVTWPIVVSKQSVFNPDYGINGIPDVVIVDPKGIVRYVDLRPDTPLQEKVQMIDKLLSEASLPTPATLIMSKSN